MPRQLPRILLVEDEDAIRRSLAVVLRNQGYQVRAEADGRAIEEIAEQFAPHLAILDVRLPVGPDGYELARRLRRQSRVPILFLTAADSLTARLEGFDAGADDYLVKPFALEELQARVKVLLRRSDGACPETWTVGDVVVDELTCTAMRAGTKLVLTRTEYQLLSVMVRHARQILSKSQLLEMVWGFEAYDENLVEVHMSSLRRKLEALGPRLIHTVRGAGYVLRD